jgi:murein DD-endopeptidase MepM/ murein hydrolase activator NlpD
MTKKNIAEKHDIMRNTDTFLFGNRVKRNTLALFIVLLMAFVSVSTAPVYAKTTDDLKGELKQAKEDAKDAKQEYQEKKTKEAELNSRIKGLEATIKQTEADLANLQKEIDTNNKKVSKVKLRIAKLETEVGDQQSNLNVRLRNMYLAGDMSIIEVLLGSENIVDFLSNLDMVKRIHELDVKTLNELNSKLAEVEQKKAELVEIKNMLKDHKGAQQLKKASLASDKKQLDAALAEAHKATVAAWEDFEDTEAASNAIAKELANRQSTTTYGGGKMGWPVNGRITSEFGNRIHPITHKRHTHKGIDIAVPMGTPVHAASAGEVIFAGWNNQGYGNLVLIDHGSNIVTAYAHNSSITCSVGQKVKRGDVIAKVGSTGASTGPHCHFEVRVSGVPQNPRGWL